MRLGAALRQETQTTAPQLRQTLQQVSQTGRSASATSDQAEQLLRESRPVLLQTLSRLLGIEGGYQKPGP